MYTVQNGIPEVTALICDAPNIVTFHSMFALQKSTKRTQSKIRVPMTQKYTIHVYVSDKKL